jgi:arabinose-5-phosphate isomerase
MTALPFKETGFVEERDASLGTLQPIQERAYQVLSLEARSLMMMADHLPPRLGEVVLRLAQTKGRVIVTGMGKSGYVGRKMAATFASTGTPSFFVHPAEASHGDMGMITPDDVVMALSNSGETTELNNLIQYTRRYHIGLVGITSQGDSTLAKAADFLLKLPDAPEACPMGLAPTTSTILMMALGDAIACALMDYKKFSPLDFKMLHPGGNLGQRLLYIHDLMHGGEEMPLIPSQTPMDQALLVMTQKRFGCVGVVDPKGGALLGVVTDGDLRRHMCPDLLHQTADQVMTTHPFVLREDMLAAEGLGYLNEKKLTNGFVVNDQGAPVGIVHIHDFLRAGI